jgi:hypothetical protein
VSILITSRPKKGCELYNVNLSLFIPQIVQVMDRYGWKTTVNPNNRKINVKKNNLVATNIYLKPKADGKIDVRYNISTTFFGWLLTMLTFQSFTGRVFKLHNDSENFAKKEVIPLILYYSSSTG